MDVVLIHGMGRTPLSMLRLRRRLRRAGHRAILFGYSPTFETLEGASARLVKRIERRLGAARYALVGHSLGTVIIRTALGRLQDRPPCRVLLPGAADGRLQGRAVFFAIPAIPITDG
jgi:pimeloyl-ACP methyl ester carboxylesterase